MNAVNREPIGAASIQGDSAHNIVPHETPIPNAPWFSITLPRGETRTLDPPMSLLALPRVLVLWKRTTLPAL